MTEAQVWIDGRLTPASLARISVYDRAFRSGQGVFETLRVYGGHPFRLAAHATRAVSSAAEIGAEVESSTLISAVEATVGANRCWLPAGDGAIRVTISAGCIDPDSPFPGSLHGGVQIVVTPHRMAAYAPTVRAVSTSLTRELGHLKATSYLVSLLAQAEADRQGADTALFVDRDGRVTEAAAANVFAVVDGRIITPPADGRLLAGITRGIVVDLAPTLGMSVAEAPLPQTDLAAATEAMLTSAVRGIVGLTTFDGTAIGDGTTGPVTAAVRDAYRDLVASERPRITGD